MFTERIILRIKELQPLGVLVPDRFDSLTTTNDFKNHAPCHLPNLNPIMEIVAWVPPIDHIPCKVCQQIDDSHIMLLYDGWNAKYHIFCSRPSLTLILDGQWFCTICTHCRIASKSR